MEATNPIVAYLLVNEMNNRVLEIHDPETRKRRCEEINNEPSVPPCRSGWEQRACVELSYRDLERMAGKFVEIQTLAMLAGV